MLITDGPLFLKQFTFDLAQSHFGMTTLVISNAGLVRPGNFPPLLLQENGPPQVAKNPEKMPNFGGLRGVRFLGPL